MSTMDLTNLGLVADSVAERLLIWTGSSTGLDAGALAAEVEASITFADRFASPRLAGNAMAGLFAAAAALSPADAATCRAELARVAVRYHRVRSMHVGCGGDPTTGIRAAQLAYDVLPEIRGGAGAVMDTGADPILTIALWVLGRWHYEQLWLRIARVLLDPQKASQAKDAAVSAASMHQWNAHRVSDRRRDVKLLLEDRPELMELFGAALSAVAASEADAAAVHAAHSGWLTAGDQGCYCRDPTTVLQALFGGRIPAPGVSLVGISAGQRVFLDKVREVSEPRSDVLVEFERAWVPEPEPFSGSFLVATLGEIPEERVKLWHESAVHAAVRSTFNSFSTCRANVEWVLEGCDQRVSGELDSLVVLDSVLLDFQAKAASSPNHASRHHLIFESAAQQHQRLRDALAGQGAWPLKRGGARSTRRPWRLDDQFLLHIPISVGVEYRRSFSVGGSLARGELPRVVTTVDHLRLVNLFVPPPFRCVYWLDRFTAEHGDLKFVDETSYLGDWLAVLHGEEVALEVAPSGIVMARNDDLGHCLSAINEAETRGDQKAAEAHLAALSARGPDRIAPRFTRLLSQLGHARVPGAMHLWRCVLNTDLAQVEARLHSGRSFRVATDGQKNGVRGLSWALDLGDGRGPMLAEGVDVVLARTGSRWDVRFPGSSIAARTRELGTPTATRFATPTHP